MPIKTFVFSVKKCFTFNKKGVINAILSNWRKLDDDATFCSECCFDIKNNKSQQLNVR